MRARMTTMSAAALITALWGLFDRQAAPLAARGAAATAEHVVAPAVAPMDLHGDVLATDALVHGGRSRYLRFARDGRLDVLVLARKDRWGRLRDAILAWGGELRFEEPSVGYMRAAFPIEHWPALRASPLVAAVSVDGPSIVHLGYDSAPRFAQREIKASAAVVPSPTDQKADVDLQALPNPRRAVGLDLLRQTHATFDGRGTTIAILEQATRMAIHHTAFTRALALDGSPRSKLVDFLPLPPSDEALASWMRPGDSGIVEDVRQLDVAEPLVRVRNETYRLPAAGRYRFGEVRFDDVVFPVVWDPGTTRTRVDVNRNRDFTDDAEIADPRRGGSVTRMPSPMSWVGVFYTLHVSPDEVHIVPVSSVHATMTSGTAAGADVPGNLARGLAPAAGLVLVDTVPVAHSIFESVIRAAKHPSVDVISISLPHSDVPNDGEHMAAMLFERVFDTYGKIIIKGVSNDSTVGTAQSLAGGGAGAYADADALRLETDARDIASDLIWPYSNRGPRLDGTLGVDFIAPATLVAPAFCEQPRKNNYIPLSNCYMTSGGTSTAAPSLAGVAASLVSGLKQQGRSTTARELLAALRSSSRYLPAYRPIDQGTGLPQAHLAWAALEAGFQDLDLEVRAPVRHAMTPYSASPGVGRGLYEREGWLVGGRGVRRVEIKRNKGPLGPATYRLTWLGDTRTFEGPRTITLPRGEWVSIAIGVTARQAGVHSAILEVRERSREFVVGQVPVTIVVPNTLQDGTLHVEAQGDQFLRAEFPFYVPPDVDRLRLAFEASDDVRVQLLEPAGWQYVRTGVMDALTYAGKTAHLVDLPSPSSGTWIAVLSSADSERSHEMRATLSVTAETRRLQTAVTPLAPGEATVSLNLLPAARLPESRDELHFDVGLADTARRQFDRDGHPLLTDITVQPGTRALRLRFALEDPAATAHAYLYDCTTGTCLRFDVVVPAVSGRVMHVERPRPGRWVLALTPGPRNRPEAAVVIEHIQVHPDDGVVRETDTDPRAQVSLPHQRKYHVTYRGAEDESREPVLVASVPSAASSSERTSAGAGVRVSPGWVVRLPRMPSSRTPQQAERR